MKIKKRSIFNTHTRSLTEKKRKEKRKKKKDGKGFWGKAELVGGVYVNYYYGISYWFGN